MSPNAEQLGRVRRLWNLSGDIEFLRKVENYVYESSVDGRPVILRLTEPSHRSAQDLESELDWIDYLSRSGMRIAAPVRSATGALVESVVGNNIFHVCVFEKAAGKPIDESEIGPERAERWGHYIGTMHCLTKAYQRSSGVQPRSMWDDDAGFHVTLAGLDEDDALPYRRFQELMEWLGNLDRSPECFGLIHCDMHHGNFFADDEGRITAFDFDDSVYHWLAYDLAIPLYYLGRFVDDGKPSAGYDQLSGSLLAGYGEANTLDSVWIDRLPLFVKFRTATLYHWRKAMVDMGALDETARTREFYAWSREQLEPELQLF